MPNVTTRNIFVPTPALLAHNAPSPQAEALNQAIMALGQNTWLDANGIAHLNNARIMVIASHGQKAIPALKRFFDSRPSDLALIEGLMAAQHLAQAHTPGIESLYASTSNYNRHPSPLVQIYLAGFYRYLQAPETFGPVLASFIKYSLLPTAPAHLTALDPIEELGGTLLQKIAQWTAQTMQANGPRPNLPTPPTPVAAVARPMPVIDTKG
jgi:hypothetical protein